MIALSGSWCVETRQYEGYPSYSLGREQELNLNIIKRSDEDVDKKYTYERMANAPLQFRNDLKINAVSLLIFYDTGFTKFIQGQ